MPKSDLEQTWISDGTASAEPVTTETPSPEPAPEPVSTGPARGPDGKFIAADAAPPPETPATPTPAPPASAVAAPAPGASAQAIQDFIDAQLGEGTVQIPKGAKLPLKRGETVEYATIEELQKRGMLELDYRHKTADLARQRDALRASEAKAQAELARAEARAQWLEEQEQAMREAQKDPQQWEAYQEMMRLYRESPQFRQRMDDALAKRETEAELAVYRERDFETAKQEGSRMAREWITELATEFPGVDPARVTTLYGQALAAGHAQLHPDAVRAIYQTESAFVQQATSPLEKQLADLTAQVAALTAAQAAEKQNATTAHALSRAKAPPVATHGLPPTSVGKPATRFTQNELPDRNSEWARQR